jgi:hypothetical protein
MTKEKLIIDMDSVLDYITNMDEPPLEGIQEDCANYLIEKAFNLNFK